MSDARSDETLMSAYAGGDAAAFDALYERYRGPLYRYLMRLCGDTVTANDLYQEAWERLIRSRERYRPARPFKPWLYRIAHNLAVDAFRRRRPTGDEDPAALRAGGGDPEQALAAAQLAQRLESALRALPVEQREALLLRLEGGLDLETLAGVTGVSREAAKSRLRYAVQKLRKSIDA